MRKLVQAVALGAVAAAAGCASTSGAPRGAVSMPVKVAEGSRYTVTAQTTVSYAGMKELEDFKPTTTVVYGLEVLSMGRDGGAWRWTVEDMDYGGMFENMPGSETANLTPQQKAALGDTFRAAGLIALDLGLECRVDATGRCVELRNWDRWRKRAHNAVDLIDAAIRLVPDEAFKSGALETPPAAPPAKQPSKPKKGAAAAAPPAPTPEAKKDEGPSPRLVMAAVSEMTSVALDGVDDRDAALLAASMHPLAALQGRTLVAQTPTRFEERWDMPFGAEPIVARGTLTLLEVDRANGSARVKREAELDRDTVKAAMTKSVGYFVEPTMRLVARFQTAEGKPEGEAQPDPAMSPEMITAMVGGMLQAMDLNISETTEGVIDLQTGLVRNSTTEMRFSFGFGPQSLTGTSTTTLTVTPGAPPERPRASLLDAPQKALP